MIHKAWSSIEAQEYNSLRFRRGDEWCAFGIAILLYIDKESRSLTGRVSHVHVDTSGVDWSEMSVGKSRIFQLIADVNDVIFILF